MLIEQLELENFKSYVHAVIPLAPGTNAIVGANGSGKSSLLEALGFALFDVTPDGFKLANLLREGSTAGRVVVTLYSSADERRYEVERGFNATTTARYRVYDLELGRAIVAEGKEAVTAWMRYHLRMEASANLQQFFENTIGVPQGTFTAPFLQAAAQRKPVFDTLLQVEDYRKASDNLRPTEQFLERRAASIAEDIARAEGQLEQLPSLEREGQEIKERLTALIEEEEVSRKALQEAEEALARHEEAERDLQAAKRDLERAHERAEMQEKFLEEATSALAEAEEAARIVEETRPAHEAFLAAEARLTVLEEKQLKRSVLREKRATLERERDRTDFEIDRVVRCLRDIAQAERDLEALAPALAEQERLEKALHQAELACLERDQAAKQLADLEDQVRAAQKEVERLAQEVEEATALAQEIEHLEKEAKAKREEAHQAASRLAILEMEKESLLKQFEALQEVEGARCPVCESELTPERREALLERNAGRLASLKRECQEAHQTREAAEGAAEKTEEEATRLKKQRDRLASEPELERARERLADLESRRDEARRDLEAHAGAEVERDRLQAKLQALGDPRTQASLYEAQIRERPRYEEELARLEERLSAFAEDLAHLDEELAAYISLDDDLADSRAIRDAHRPDHERYLAHSQVASQLAARRTTLEKRQEELRASLAEVERLEDSFAQAQAAYDAEAHHKAYERVTYLKDTLSRLDQERKMRQDRAQEIQQQLKALYALKDELARRKEERARVEELRKALNWARSLLREAGPYITRQLVRRISYGASTLYRDIMGDYSGHLEWSEDYELSLEVRGNHRTFRQLSGGEQMCAALALRLALLREMSNVDIAFFDEPTTNLDADRREGLAERIMQVRGFSQLFVISHDDTFERAAQNFIRIVKDASGSHVEIL